MVKQLLRDESGVALGIAMMVMVLVGVMGAGFLVFVRNDLEAVIEVNQGQRAFDIADTGAQVAKQQLLGDKVPSHYDVEDVSHPDYVTANCNTDANDPDDAIDTANDIQRAPSGESWAPDDGGQTRSFADGQFTVTIRWLNPDPSSDPDCIAPETTSLPEPGVAYFKVISTGEYRNAIRRIEVIYETYLLNIPRAYYTPGEIRVNGDACVSQVSLFSLSDVTFAGGGNGCDGTGSSFKGNDLYYGNWNRPPFNTVPRPVSLAGVGTAGEITGSPKLAGGTASEGTRDFDKSTTPPLTGTPAAGEMTFPFDVGAQPDARRLCDEAIAQGNYIRNTGSGNADLSAWPSSNPNTVVCYEFTNDSSNHVLSWKVNDSPNDDLTALGYPGCRGPIQDGTLVVIGGGFTVSPNTDLLRGVVVVRGADAAETSEVEDAGLSGRGCLDGFINSTGPITISGAITPFNSSDVNNRPGFFGVRTWGWRELYQ